MRGQKENRDLNYFTSSYTFFTTQKRMKHKTHEFSLV